jgi:hypothetical protein
VSTRPENDAEVLPEYDLTGGVRGKYSERYHRAPLKPLDAVVLERDLPEHGLRRGDLGAVVDVHGSNVVEVEFVQTSGRTQALVTVDASDVRAAEAHDMVAARKL